MEFLLLGSLEVRAGPQTLRIGGAKQRALLALLLLHANDVVSRDRLIDELWGEQAGERPRSRLDVEVSRLRKTLGVGVIVTHPAGYAIRLEPDDLDLRRFERLLDEGRRANAAGRPRRASAVLDEALGLWRGDALSDVAYEAFARSEVERLEELRLVAVEERVEAQLALGNHDPLVAELEALTMKHPLRERLRGQLMVALYRAGRPGEALGVYADTRRHLVEELGIEPGRGLRELERSILLQEAQLAAPAAGDPRARTNLPTPSTRLLGRDREIGEVLALLRDPDVRLVTITGAGGTGKTRLALAAAAAAADDYEDGICLVELAALRDPDLVMSTVAQRLGAANVARHVGDKQLLLILDNFEQIVEAARDVARLLAECARLNVLVTSREPLHVSAEQEYEVQPLSESDAVALFVERARAIRRDVDADASVAEICRRLDRLPLALELAAARVKVLSTHEIVSRLDQRLPLLVGGARDLPERQQTLRATIEWSYDLLDEPEQRLAAEFSIFRGGCTLDAVEAICGAGVATLASLLDKNLLRRTGERFVILETVGEFAAERLAARVDRPELCVRHAEYFLASAERITKRLEEKPDSAEGRRLRDELASEIDNHRAALEWSIERQDGRLGLRLCVALATLFWHRNVDEGVRWLERILALPGDERSPTRAAALRRAGQLAAEAGAASRALEHLEASLSLYRELGDERRVAELLGNLATAAHRAGDTTRTRTLLEQAADAFRSLDLADGLCDVLHNLGELELADGNLERSEVLLEESLTLARDSGDDHAAWTILHGLGDLALEQTAVELADTRYRESLHGFWSEQIPRSCAYSLGGLAAVAALRGDVTRAGRLWGALEAVELTRSFRIYSVERARYERRLAAIGGDEFAAAVDLGRTLSLNEAAAAALA